MKKYFAILLFSLSMISCKSEATVEKEVRTIENFSSINITSGIDVVYTQADLSPITIEATADLISKTVTIVKDGTLIISRSDNPKQTHDKKNNIKVHVSSLRLDYIMVSEGSEFFAAEIKGEHLFSITCLKGGGIKIDQLNIRNDTKIELTDGADCDIKELRTINCTIHAGKACDAKIKIISDSILTVDAGMTSDIILKGKVHEFIINKNTGADIEYRELKYDILTKR